jgi:hypothetical protein
MLNKFLRLMVCAALLLAAGTASAQGVSATVLLKSGEKVTGNLLDLDARGLVMSVSGQQRNIPVNDAAVIDFSGNASSLPSSEVQKVAAGQNLVIFKDGRQVQGKLDDLGGNGPLNVYFTESGRSQQSLSSANIDRIYLAQPSGAVATSGTPAAQAGAGGETTVRVPANREWTPTGITVQQGQTIQLSASGEVSLSRDANDNSPVTGSDTRPAAARASLPTTLRGALIGRIGNGRPFGIGNQTSITAPATGPLYLGVNDDEFSDNSGEFTVSISGGAATGMRGIRRR